MTKKEQELTAVEIVQRCTGYSKHEAQRIAGKLEADKVQALYADGKGDELRAMIAAPPKRESARQPDNKE